MRKPIIAGNWKMNKTLAESKTFVTSIIPLVTNINECEIIIAPPYIALDAVNQLLNNTSISLAAQNIATEKEGAYTGDISVSMIKSCNCSHVIIGHSEQRLYHNETNQKCHIKCKLSLENDITPIYCVGETLAEREANKTLAVIKNQLLECLDNISLESKEIIIAYEPVWAIGTGKVATPEQAQDVHTFIRETVAKEKGETVANKTRILYGGSVKPDNIDDLIKQPDIDGALVGGACLKADSFVELINKTNYVTH